MHISQFLEKFKRVGLREIAAREAIAHFLSEHYRTPFAPKDISIKNAVAMVKASPAVKNDIFIKKQQFIASLQEKLPGTPLRDIR